MKRREFLVRIGELIVIIPAASVLASCGSAPPKVPSLSYTSSNVQGHTHVVAIADSLLSAPPLSPPDMDTSSVFNHIHTVTLTQANLQDIENGQTVQITTSTADGHTHAFGFSKASGQAVG
jgi:hypothetical protein